MRILVIDDEPDILLLCRVNLEMAGHDVLEAGTGEQGLELALLENPDVILLDLMLPERDGLSILADLNADDRTRRTPVILLTAKNQQEDRLAGWRAGCSEYVTKPFSPVALAETVDRIHAMSAEEHREHRVRELDRLSRTA